MLCAHLRKNSDLRRCWQGVDIITQRSKSLIAENSDIIGAIVKGQILASTPKLLRYTYIS
jgi:hypothetical protein